MKVLITHHLSDRNLGDAAILEGLVKALVAADPGVQISLMPTARLKDLSDIDLQHTRSLQLKVVPSLFAPSFSASERHKRDPRNLLPILRGAVLIPLIRWLPRIARLFMTADERRTLSVFEQADLVIAKGGTHFLLSRRRVRPFHVWRMAVPLLTAHALHKRVLVMGTSVGGLQSPLGRFLTRALRTAAAVYCRDLTSQQYAYRFLGRRAKFIPDLALVLYDETRVRAARDRLLVITVRPLSRDRHVHAVHELAQLPEALRSELDRVVVLVGSLGPQDDLPTSESLVEELHQRGVPVTLAAPQSLEEELELLATASLVIGIRMHSAVMARVVGTPSLAIDYEGDKARGVFQYLAPSAAIPSVESFKATDIVERVGSYLRNGLPAEDIAAIRQRKAEALLIIKSEVERVRHS